MFSDPEALVYVVGALIVTALMTVIVARVLGMRIARRNLILARIVTAIVVPALTLGFGVIRFRIDVAAHPGSDWPAMGMAGIIMITQIMLIVTIPIAWLALPRR
jgi:hypothetical protein